MEGESPTLKKLHLTRKTRSNGYYFQGIRNVFSKNIGYRQITKFISLKYGIKIAKQDVRKALLILDPVEVERRKHKVIKRRVYESSSPMNTLYIDGNDKLKRFGFPIYGCVDRFSRKLTWLVFSASNNNTLVIANHFFIHIEASQRLWNRKCLL